jgi:hypothetical protein
MSETSPIPTIGLGSLHSITPKPIVGIVVPRARHSAKIRAKSLIVLNKNYSNHRAPMQWNGSCWPKISPIFALQQAWSIWYSRAKHAVHSYLRNRTTSHSEYLIGSTVNNLLELWVCKLFCLKRHPSIQKSKIFKYRALLQWKEKNTFRWVHPGSLIGIIQEEDCTVPKST